MLSSDCTSYCFTVFYLCRGLKHSTAAVSVPLCESTLSFPLLRVLISFIWILADPKVSSCTFWRSACSLSNNCSTWLNINHCNCATLVDHGMVLHILYRAILEIRLFGHWCPVIVLRCLQWKASSLSIAAFRAAAIVNHQTHKCCII